MTDHMRGKTARPGWSSLSPVHCTVSPIAKRPPMILYFDKVTSIKVYSGKPEQELKMDYTRYIKTVEGKVKSELASTSTSKVSQRHSVYTDPISELLKSTDKTDKLINRSLDLFGSRRDKGILH